MNIKELKEWLLSEIAQATEQQKGFESAEQNVCVASYKSRADALNDVYQKLCIYFKDKE